MKVLAPSSSRWLEAVASYGSAISPPPSNETPGGTAAGVKLHRQPAAPAASSESGGGSGSSGSSGRKGVVELVDSAPLQKYGVRLYTIAVSGYVQSQSDGADYQGGASFHFISFYPDNLRTNTRKCFILPRQAQDNRKEMAFSFGVFWICIIKGAATAGSST